MSNPSITADKTPWYQWDTGLTVTVSGGEMDECHFANRKQGTAYVQAVINGVARVPDELLQVAAPIKAYGYVSDGAGGQTYVEQTFEVIARNIPADYTYTKTAQKTIRDAEQARDEAVQAANNAKASELAADDSAVEASTSAQSAGESASAAATSASNAAKSAGDAAKSASDAKAAADKAVDDASELLKTYTDNAKTSADNAATSASNAADSASAASGSASAAEQSATDASNAKAAAQTAKAEAEAAKSEAATSASNAAASATAAAKSASDAAASVGAINVIAPKTVETSALNSFESVAFGDGAASKGGYSVAIGTNAKANALGSIAIGSGAHDNEQSGNSNVVIGDGANIEVDAAISIAIGSSSIAKKSRECSIGNDTLTREITHVSAPTTDNSAATKKYTDDNDAKTLSEAKKYTDDNTSNALVGTVSGKLLHVDDAWPSKPLSVTVDGAYKQDGTPSPESPVPITVIENPVVNVTGRNICDDVVTTGNIKLLNATFKNTKLLKGIKYTISLYVVGGVSFDANVRILTRDGRYINSVILTESSTTRTFTAQESGALNINGYNLNGTIESIKVMLELGPTATDYEQYVGTSLPITLPVEHPYLAKLPDGTCDTIEIDKYGNVSLVARVQKVDVSNLPAPSAIDVLDNGLTRYQYWSVIDPLARNDSAVIAPAFKSVVDFSFPQQGMYASNVSIIVGASADPTDALKAGGYIYTTLGTPITYQLGKLDIPSLPETISNVWTDAELTTDMSMTYKRDINIAFENLAQAVVAAAAGE